MKILVIEDDHGTSEILRSGLTSAAHTVEVAENGNDGSFMGRSFVYDAIILDYSLPKKDGLTVCKEIRSIGKSTPIIFLSVNDDPELKVSAFNVGADDYMTKPFALQELYARLRMISKRPNNVAPPILRVHDLIIDPDRNSVTRASRRIKTTRKEFCILEYLIKNVGTIISRALIMEHAWTADSNPFSNTVEAHMRNLRKKLNVGRKPNLIMNIPGRGYVIDTPQNLKKLYNI
ncbi:MAG: response regulator transcription factor [Candidatus Taylorbacteria bacterium]